MAGKSKAPKRLLLKQMPAIVEAVRHAEPSLFPAGRKIDERKLLAAISGAQDNARLAQQLSDKKAIRIAIARLDRLGKAATALSSQLAPFCFTIDSRGNEKPPNVEDLRGRIVSTNELSMSIDDLKKHVDQISAAAAESRPHRLEIPGSINQFFVGEGLSRVYKNQFADRPRRKRVPVPNAAHGEDTVGGAFVAFAGAVMAALKTPLTPETISSMMKNKKRRAGK